MKCVCCRKKTIGLGGGDPFSGGVRCARMRSPPWQRSKTTVCFSQRFLFRRPDDASAVRDRRRIASIHREDVIADRLLPGAWVRDPDGVVTAGVMAGYSPGES
jgi:hypothetical protein